MTVMDLDDWKTLWAAHDRKLDTSLRLNRRLLEESSLGRARTALGSLKRSVVIDLIGNLIWVVALVAFAAAYPQARFMAPALLLAVGAVALVRSDVLQLLAARIDPGEPIAAAQRRLEGLRRLRVTHVRWTLLLAPLAWPPLAVVALKVLFGVDAWVVPGLAWLLANVAFGVAVPVIAWMVSVRYGARLRGSPWVARMANAISGRSLADAMHALRAIEELEHE
jgi:hypothetical protein